MRPPQLAGVHNINAPFKSAPCQKEEWLNTRETLSLISFVKRVNLLRARSLSL